MSAIISQGLRFLLAFCMACVSIGDLVRAQDDSLFEKFTTNGIELNASTVIVLPRPLLDSKPLSEAKPLLQKLSERQGWDRFSKNSVSSPILVDLSYVLDGGKKSTGAPSNQAGGKDTPRVGHAIYSAFIAYSPLKSLKDEQLMSSLFGSSNEDKEQMGFDPVQLAPEVLKLVGITDVGPNTRYSTLRIPLMNRVVIEGTARIDKIESNGSVLIAWQLDPHFTVAKPDQALPELAKYINRSRKVGRDELGKVTESEPVSYVGCGGYLCVTETGLAANQLLIESRFVMHEPNDWFSGSNFLRSKFPTAMQESAQNFRRKLSGK
ncbi:MAG: hypothetical protein U0930_09350 [Pirellulales bacterium]